jgi:hypothetical protein
VAGAATTTAAAGVITTTIQRNTPPPSTVAADDAGLRVDAEGRVVTIPADAGNAGTAVVRVTGPGVDRPYLMAIDDGVAEVELPFEPDVTATGVSSSGLVEFDRVGDCEA